MTDGKKQETPRTDAVALRLVGVDGLFCDDKSLSQYNDLVDVSRALEADLLAAQKELAEATRMPAQQMPGTARTGESAINTTSVEAGTDYWEAQAKKYLTEFQSAAARAEKAEQALALRGEPVAETSTAYNAWEYFKVRDDVIGTVEKSRIASLPAWARALIEHLVTRIYNLRKSLPAVSGERTAEELDGTCARCGEIYDLPAGNDPTKYCHDCAHERVEELEQALALRGEPVAWMFQHDETGRFAFCANDGINTPETFLRSNTRYGPPITLISGERAGTIGHVSHNRPAADALAAVSGEPVAERVAMLERALQSKDAFVCVATPIPCLICTDGDVAQQLWFVPKGCICSDNPVQALCLQHVKTLEPISGASFIAHIATVAEPAVSGERAECEQAKRVAQVCYDLHEALGVKWGDDPYAAIRALRVSGERVREAHKGWRLLSQGNPAVPGFVHTFHPAFPDEVAQANWDGDCWRYMDGERWNMPDFTHWRLLPEPPSALPLTAIKGEKNG